jgi:hypothetical protein
MVVKVDSNAKILKFEIVILNHWPVRENQGLLTDESKVLKRFPRNGLLTVGTLVVVIVVVLFVMSRIPYTTYTTLTKESQPLIGTETLNLAGQGFSVWTFTLQSNMTNIHINGTFASNESVYFLVMNENQYSSVSIYKSLITNPSYSLWSSGNTTSENVSANITPPSGNLPPQTYFIMIYNANPYQNSSQVKNVAGVNITSSVVLTFDYENTHFKVLL